MGAQGLELRGLEESWVWQGRLRVKDALEGLCQKLRDLHGSRHHGHDHAKQDTFADQALNRTWPEANRVTSLPLQSQSLRHPLNRDPWFGLSVP